MKKFASLLLTLSLMLGVATVTFAQDPPKKEKKKKEKKMDKMDKMESEKKKPA